MGKLTDMKVRNAKSGIHGDGAGLYLRVKPSGAKSWVLRVQFQGRREDIGLGGYPADLTLGEAREKAGHLRKLARQGKNARAERESSAKIPTRGEPSDGTRPKRRDVGSQQIHQRRESQPDGRGLTLGMVAIGLRIPRTQIDGNRIGPREPAPGALDDCERAWQSLAVIAGQKTSRPPVITADGARQRSGCPCLVARACHHPPAPLLVSDKT